MVLQDTGSSTVLYGQYRTANRTSEAELWLRPRLPTRITLLTLPGAMIILGEDGTNISQGQRQLLTIARRFWQTQPF